MPMLELELLLLLLLLLLLKTLTKQPGCEASGVLPARFFSGSEKIRIPLFYWRTRHDSNV
ncbi:hypothetical protein [Bradyrhizobium sp. 195]|uniref:hypothetical protein n=1 Tax=Bradyrhizobium sp. 195 TaxID=2782662 RepID=UPI002000D47E|nr:hypothetical protein [Bradyrhizobium sp. 195]UPK30845.1 hypothetical protein IVB26_39950 [Bradyrhizobium sp. 195]